MKYFILIRLFVLYISKWVIRILQREIPLPNNDLFNFDNL